MELIRKGYKKTDAGLIPEDWATATLSELTDRIGDGIHTTPVYSETGMYFFINGNNLGNGRITFDENTKRVSQDEYKIHKRELTSNTILLSINGTIGSIAFYNDEPIVLGKSAAYLNLNSKVDKNYIFSILQTKSIQKFFENELTGSTIRNLGLGVIRKTPIPVPPTFTEQKAIANALSDVDALITNLEKLIAKKKGIKQGAMQQLLTPPHKGGKRLEGFRGEWKEMKLGEVTKIKTGSRNNQDKVEEGLFPFFVRSQTVERINSYSYDCEAILIPGEGGIGSIFHYINGKFEVHQRVYKISDFKTDVLGKYVFLQMRFSFGKHAMNNSVKATVDSLRLPTLEGFLLYLPSDLEEQKAISEVLDEMNFEIDSLERERKKHLSIKQGMMQELLTGKTRLI